VSGAQLFLNLGARRGCVVSITPRPPLPQEIPGTHYTGGWVGPGAGLDRCGKSRPTGIRSPDLPARSKSLYLLRYPGSKVKYLHLIKDHAMKVHGIWLHIFITLAHDGPG
jgi:hypothetical protein